MDVVGGAADGGVESARTNAVDIARMVAVLADDGYRRNEMPVSARCLVYMQRITGRISIMKKLKEVRVASNQVVNHVR